MMRFLTRAATAVALICSASMAAALDWGQHFGETRGWEVRQSDMVGCFALSPGTTAINTIFLISPMGNFELLFPTKLPEETEIPVTLDIDGRRYSDTFYAWQGNAHGVFETPLRETVAAGNTMIVSMDGQSYNVPLAGATAALLKLQECWYDLTKPSPDTNRELPVALPSKQGAGPATGQGPAPTVGAVQGIAAEQACLPRNGVASPNVQDMGDITFENRGPVLITVYWVDYAGQGQEMAFLQPGQSVFINSFASHLFYALDGLGACHGPMVEVPFGTSTHAFR
ncbi:VHL beta domain-containing protein [Chachezhania sediminis]|uniref:VHL beta domain-containing protein n=1 Tax=Chachezhania sediminis TaxID=2599291 RepID=UPI00131B3D74|nr:hypothetical protein [Chachezhania sediminis]